MMMFSGTNQLTCLSVYEWLQEEGKSVVEGEWGWSNCLIAYTHHIKNMFVRLSM